MFIQTESRRVVSGLEKQKIITATELIFGNTHTHRELKKLKTDSGNGYQTIWMHLSQWAECRGSLES